MAGELPLLGRQESVVDRGQRQVRPLAEAEAARHRRDVVDPDAAGDLVIVDVAGFPERLHELHLPVPATPPAVEEPVAKLVFAVAEHPLAG